ncbi:MAG: Hsp20 family protein [Planctomycetes bacterium]|jgi:HSP20 family protein|nr:Hsp20/alpha crystallin family protein [Phycisphaerae bacterium]NBB95799.1 Hsp20 family protein [Planctomycetota bacterium]
MIDISIVQAADTSRPGDRAPRAAGSADVRASYHAYCPGETWKPAVNLYEDEVNYYVVVDLSGTGSHAIEVHYHDGELTIAGHRPTPPPPECVGELKLHHMEIDHGKFQRSVRMPADVDVDTIDAVYRTGQLLITLPKRR